MTRLRSRTWKRCRHEKEERHMSFGTDIGGVRRTRSVTGETNAGFGGEVRRDRDEASRPEREPEPPVRLGGLHLAARKNKRDVFSG